MINIITFGTILCRARGFTFNGQLRSLVQNHKFLTHTHQTMLQPNICNG